MSLKEQLQSDLKEAMKSGDAVRKSAIRMAISAIKNAEIDKGGPLTDEEAQDVLRREVKKRRESIEQMDQAGRADLAEQERLELDVLEQYLPRQLDRDEIEAEARSAIEEVGAESPRDIGKVMRVLMARLKGRADGKLVSQIVRELLSQ